MCNTVRLPSCSILFFIAFAPSAFAWDDELPKTPALHKQLSGLLQEQADAWNRGSIEEFMQAYWKSDQLTFSSGGDTRRGWQTTLDRYKSSYPDQAAMGKLVFSKLETRGLSTGVALMLGRWKLKRDAPLEDLSGNFSLVWQEIEGKWVIVHDHTSSDPQEP